jgi:putrescine aminotransferase
MVREICTKYDVLLIADEVMTGFGRTGKAFAIEHWGIKPDIMAMAKGISSAYLPFGAVAVNDNVYDGLEGSALSTFTYSGHPVCAAVASKVMQIYIRDKVFENAANMGKYAMERLKAQFLPLPCVGEVSGLGLMIGIEIVADKATGKPLPPGLLFTIQAQALQSGLFIRVADSAFMSGSRVGFSPPLVITKKELDGALDMLYPILANLG